MLPFAHAIADRRSVGDGSLLIEVVRPATGDLGPDALSPSPAANATRDETRPSPVDVDLWPPRSPPCGLPRDDARSDVAALTALLVFDETSRLETYAGRPPWLPRWTTIGS
jgi:hypothetical protein